MNLYNPQQNQLKTIKLLLEQLLLQTARLEQQDQPLRRLDLDVMLKRTHLLYETLCDIPVGHERAELQEERQANPIKPAIADIEKISVQEPKHVEIETENVVEKTSESKPIAVDQKQVNKEQAVEPIAEQLPEPIFEPEPKAEQLPTPLQEKTLSQTPAEAEPKKDVEKPIKTKNTATPLDLFAEDAVPSIADHLQQQTDKSVGDRIGRQPIEEIRTAIGINDKFLFINELFSGSLENYNKMLDELNEFKSFNGASTYLIELKVVNQWDGNSGAWRKLVGLIERKFDVNPEDHAL